MHVDSCTCLYSIDSSLPPGEGQMENLQIKVHFCNLTQNIVVTLHYLVCRYFSAKPCINSSSNGFFSILGMNNWPRIFTDFLNFQDMVVFPLKTVDVVQYS